VNSVKKESDVLTTDVSTVAGIMLHDILIPARHFFRFLLRTEKFVSSITTIYADYDCRNFGAEIPGVICGFLL
jgi:hypothetical protein